MGKMRTVCAAAVCLGAACLAGCDKKVSLTFVNLTSESLDVRLNSPAFGPERVGVVPAAGKLTHKLKFQQDDLPATCAWSAGQYHDQFTVNKKTPDQLWIDIRPMGGPRVRDKHTTVNEKTKVETGPVIIHQDTVVE